jgi:hypothetical protein
LLTADESTQVQNNMSDPAVTAPAAEAPEDFNDYISWRESGGEPKAPAVETTPSGAAKPAAESVPDSEAGKEAEQEEPAARKGKGGFQRRIDRLTRENAELQEKLADWEATGGKPAARASETSATPAEPAARPKVDDFDDYDKYVEALADWKTDQKVAALVATQQKSQAEQAARERETERARGFQARAKAAAEKYPDFAAVAYSEDTPVSETMREVILESEHGAELAYWLGSHVDEAVRISQLSPVAAAREMGRLEAQIAAQNTPPAAPKTQPKLTRAPEPIRPVNTATKTSAPSVMDEELAADFSAWEKVRMAQRKR